MPSVQLVLPFLAAEVDLSKEYTTSVSETKMRSLTTLQDDRQTYFLRVDNHNIVAHVLVRKEGWFVLAP